MDNQTQWLRFKHLFTTYSRNATAGQKGRIQSTPINIRPVYHSPQAGSIQHNAMAQSLFLLSSFDVEIEPYNIKPWRNHFFFFPSFMFKLKPWLWQQTNQIKTHVFQKYKTKQHVKYPNLSNTPSWIGINYLCIIRVNNYSL